MSAASLPWRSLGLYLLAALLVTLYASGFPVWRTLSETLGPSVAAAVPLVAALLAALAVVSLIRSTRLRVGPLLLALVVAAVGLLLTDPAFPAKRVHVAQYLLLAALVHRALPTGLGAAGRVLVATLAGALFGLHDEMVQGLLPDRTFGLADVSVNASGALAGALLAASLGADEGRGMESLPWTFWALLLAVALFTAAIAGLGGPRLPTWPAAPLLGIGAAALLLDAPRGAAARHALALIGVLGVSLALYPVIGHVVAMDFR